MDLAVFTVNHRGIRVDFSSVWWNGRGVGGIDVDLDVLSMMIVTFEFLRL